MVLADSHQVSRARCYSGVYKERRQHFMYGAITLYGAAFLTASTTSTLCNSPTTLTRHQVDPTTPRWQRRQALHHPGLGSSHFARRYSGSRCYFPFLAVLRCFSSRSSLYLYYVFTQEWHPITGAGFPHSEILGSRPSRRLPEAYRSHLRPSSVVGAKASTVGPS